MAKTGSYIKLDRGLKKNSLWLERPFSKGQAWVDLLLLAQGVDKDKQYRGQVQHQKSGVVYTSILYLTNRWGWSRNKVYRFLDYLINAGMIVIQGRTPNDTTMRTRNGTTNGTIIAIENWALYQDHDTNNGTPNGTQKRTRNGTHNIKHIRESNKEKAIQKEAASQIFPCGAGSKPEWMADGLWETVKYRTVDNIPGIDRGFYDLYIEYAEELHRQGRDVK